MALFCCLRFGDMLRVTRFLGTLVTICNDYPRLQSSAQWFVLLCLGYSRAER